MHTYLTIPCYQTLSHHALVTAWIFLLFLGLLGPFILSAVQTPGSTLLYLQTWHLELLKPMIWIHDDFYHNRFVTIIGQHLCISLRILGMDSHKHAEWLLLLMHSIFRWIQKFMGVKEISFLQSQTISYQCLYVWHKLEIQVRWAECDYS